MHSVNVLTYVCVLTDRDGCVADSALFKTTTDVMTWPQSHHYCLNISYQLSTPSNEIAQKEMTNFLQNNGSRGFLWIGLRRSLSLFTSEWYWQKGNDSEYSVNYTKWADGHPDKPWKALCAAVSQDANQQFSWKSVSCCTKLRPICHKQGKYFSDMIFNTLYDHFSITYQKVCPSCWNYWPKISNCKNKSYYKSWIMVLSKTNLIAYL